MPKGDQAYLADWFTLRGAPCWEHGGHVSKQLKGLILAQNERWRRGLGMQVERKGPARGTRAAKGTVMRGYLPSGPG